MNETLKQAINRSLGHSERARVDYAGDYTTLMADLRCLYDGDIDGEAELDGTIDVWGWKDGISDNDQEWRLCVSLV